MTARPGPASVAGLLALGLPATSCGGADDPTAGATPATDTTPVTTPEPADEPAASLDLTCEYDCMVTEYAYWAHTSLLGGQVGRAAEIGHEWRLGTPGQVRATDTAATAILEDPALGLPTVLPDGDHTG